MRTADLRFVLDCLAVLNRGGNPGARRRPILRGLRGSPDLSRTRAFGHSRGRATAAAVMDADARVKTGMDLDPTLLGPVVERGLDRPFLLMDTSGHDGLNKDAS